MTPLFKIAPKLAVALPLLLAVAGCSTDDAVDYLIGDAKPKPAKPAAPAATTVHNQLPSAPELNTFQSADAKDGTRTIQAAATPPKSKVSYGKGSQRVIAVVSDKPITDYDVNQRMRLNEALGYAKGSIQAQRALARQQVIDDIIKRTEAKRFKVVPEAKHIDKAIETMAKGSNMTVDQLTARLKSKGVSMRSFRSQVEATMVFRWLLQRQKKLNVEVTDAEVDHRYARLDSDPRMKPVAVYVLQEITLPVENSSQAMYSQLLQARAIEGQMIARRYKGCKSARQASKGIFNVKIGRRIEAPVDKMPKQMRQVLRQTGPGKLIGPMRAPNGIRLIGYCGKRSIRPPKPKREVVKNIILNEKYSQASERVMRDLRRKVYVDYKDQG